MGPAVTFEPRHSQPFTLEQAMQLEVDILAAEISRLENSIRHLQRTQDELRAFLLEEPEEDNGEGEFTKAVAENEVVISSQRERITLIKIALLNKVGEGGAKHYGLDTGPLQPPKSDPPASTSNDASEDGLHL